jgi:hypothetical protein
MRAAVQNAEQFRLPAAVEFRDLIRKQRSADFVTPELIAVHAGCFQLSANLLICQC